MSREIYLTNCVFTSKDIKDIILDICSLFECDMDYTGDNGEDFTWSCALEDGCETSEEWLIKSAMEYAEKHDSIGDVVDYILDEYFDRNTNYYDGYVWDWIYDNNNKYIGISIAYVGD